MISVPVGDVTGHTSSSAWSMQSVKHRGPFVLSHWYRSRIVILKYNKLRKWRVPANMPKKSFFQYLFYLVNEGPDYFVG